MYKACTRATSLVPNLQKFRELPDFQNNFDIPLARSKALCNTRRKLLETREVAYMDFQFWLKPLTLSCIMLKNGQTYLSGVPTTKILVCLAIFQHYVFLSTIISIISKCKVNFNTFWYRDICNTRRLFGWRPSSDALPPFNQ